MSFRNLMDLAGISNRKKKQLSARTSAPRSSAADIKKAVLTKACTTELVGDVMESYFRHQIAGMTQRHPSEDGEMKKRKNQIDEPCGSEGDEDVDTTSDSSAKENRQRTSQAHHRAMRGHGGITWVGDPVGEEKQKTYFAEVQIGQERFRAGDAALFCCQDEATSEANTYVRRLEHLYERDDLDKTKMAHVSWFARGSETVLGDVADEREVFRLIRCSEERLSNIVGRASVSYWPQHQDWRKLGGNKEDAREPPVDEEDPDSYWYRMSYDPECARFEHAPFHTVKSKACSVCPEFEDAKAKASVEAFGLLDCKSDERGRFQWAGFKAMGARFVVGDAVFLASHSSTGGDASQATKGRPKRELDEDKYPEIYRYKSTVIKGSNERCPRPLQVGIIKEVYSIDPERKGNGRAIPRKRKFKICLRKLYRPEDTCLTADEAFAQDLNLVYWSEDFVSTSDIASVRGKVTVRAGSALQQRPEEWREEGTHRFYYKEAYNRSKRCFEELTKEAELYGVFGSGKGCKEDSAKSPDVQDESALPKIGRRLATLDVFSGCGGLSRGLHEAGVAESRWAIELLAPAARAFKANNPDCTVFTEDCNKLLDLAMKGRETNGKGQRLPRKGKIDLLCGGPPCQGFSSMNRFNEREYSAFKNSLCTTFLSYADFYRPRFLILENVRNFVSFKNSVVLKLCLQALLKIGYACTFGILQAGNFGVPQTRRRVIILAAAPGEELPLLPEPQTCFAKSTLHVTIGDTSYGSNCRWREEAPYRTITVRDCMSDLPSIGRRNEDVMSYGRDPVSDFQRSMRRGVPDNGLRDHVRKIMSCLVDKRIEYIPREPGSDWRDLPNIVVKLADGTYTDKLVYRYDIEDSVILTRFSSLCHCHFSFLPDGAGTSASDSSLLYLLITDMTTSRRVDPRRGSSVASAPARTGRRA